MTWWAWLIVAALLGAAAFFFRGRIMLALANSGLYRARVAAGSTEERAVRSVTVPAIG